VLAPSRPSTGRLAAGLTTAVVGGAIAAATAWALVADGKNLWATVSGTVGAILGFVAPLALGAVQGRTTRRAEQRKEADARRRAAEAVRASELPRSVAWLLHPSKAVVTFFGREQALAQLEAWCTDRDGPAVRLVTAPGGYGKTRLAGELCIRLPGWDPLWVAVGKEAATADLLSQAGGRRLLVVDYADSRDPAGLAELLAAAARAPEPVKVLALARTAGPWWTSLSASCPSHAALVDALTTASNVVALDARADDRPPDQIVASAAAQFAEHLRCPPPPPGVRSALPAGTALLRLHAEALLTVLGRQPPPHGGDGVIGEVLGHEQRYWRACARRAKVPLPDDPHDSDQLLRRVAGIAALLGADAQEVTGLLHRALDHDPADPPAAAWERWLRDLYPHDGTDDAPERLGTLQPDLLCETLAVQTLTTCTDQHRTTILTGLSDTQAVHVLTLLGRATTHQPDATSLIDAALAADTKVMAGAVLAVARQFPGLYAPRLAALIPHSGLTPSDLKHLYWQVPYPSRELNPVALAITTTVLEQQSPDTPVAERATWWNWHAVGLAEVGRRVEALAVSEEAVRLRRELADADRDAYLPDLAMSVNNHAVRLAEVGRRVEALAASEEAVTLYRDLAEANRDAYLPDLATSVNNHANRLAQAGWRVEALAASEEAVRLRRELVEANRGTYLPDLAMSVNNHAVGLAEVGRRVEALAASEEAVTLSRELAEVNRDAYLPDLANSLWNVGWVCVKLGAASGQAVEATAEAVSLFEGLAAAEPAAFSDRLRAAAGTLAALYEAMGDAQAAESTRAQYGVDGP